jgi:hypothetical protein
MTGAIDMSSPVTRDDLRGELAPLATKAEFVPLATKVDLQAAIAPLATKAELLATKADLQAAIALLITKADLELWGRVLLARMDELEQGLERLAAELARLQCMEGLEQRLAAEITRCTQEIVEATSNRSPRPRARP